MKKPIKPTKPPPPPPPPPKEKKPYLHQTGCSSACGSDYAESVCSAPLSTHSLQPHFRLTTPCGSDYLSCKSESQASICYSASPCCFARNLPAIPSASEYLSCRSESQASLCYSASTCSYGKNLPPIPRAPIPRERVSKQRIMVESPTPLLKGNKDPAKYKEYKRQDRCKPKQYTRYVEQHVKWLFKYLKERQERRLKEMTQIRKCYPNIDEQQVSTLMRVQAKVESMHLRTLRCRLSANDFDIKHILGSGAIGTVSLVKYKHHERRPLSSGRESFSSLYAMKTLKKSQVFADTNSIARAVAERDILAEADNEWVVKLYCSFQDDLHLYFILEYVPGGDMMNLLATQHVFPESWARFYIAEISIGLQFVHDKGFIHRDIKPDNILIDEKGHIKLTDFGLCTGFRLSHDSNYYKDETLNGDFDSTSYRLTNLSINDVHASSPKELDHPTITRDLARREIEHSSRKMCVSVVGSPNYIAPEVLRAENATKLCDWWSVGVILYEMVVGYCPFINLRKLKAQPADYNCANESPFDIQSRILEWQNNLAFPEDSHGGPISPDVNGIEHPISEATKDLIKLMLCEPKDRICQNGISDITNHPFFGSINWKNIRSTQAPFVPMLENELDRKYFEYACAPQSSMRHALSGNVGQINDFTYRCFP